jgi:hypothetical protein
MGKDKEGIVGGHDSCHSTVAAFSGKELWNLLWVSDKKKKKKKKKKTVMKQVQRLREEIRTYELKQLSCE